MDSRQRTLTPGTILIMLFLIVVVPLLPLLISRQWDWWEAWVYALVSILGFAISRLLAARRHPDLMAERVRSIRYLDAKPWDKYLTPIVGFGGGLVALVAGLDALYDWSPSFGLPVIMLALGGILAGYVLGSYALIENRFFSGTVRIQTERGHRLVSSGPYAWIRHPGYAGALLTYLSTPFFLDSWWAMIPALALAITLVIRTSLEDRTLQEELEGYRAYTSIVRYRLLPGVW